MMAGMTSSPFNAYFLQQFPSPTHTQRTALLSRNPIDGAKSQTSVTRLRRGKKREMPGIQGLKACARCRTMKTRCEGERPCTACVKRGRADECVGAKSDSCNNKAGPIEKPLTWREFGVNIHVSDNNEGRACQACLEELTSHQVAEHFLSFPFFGSDAARVKALLASMPDNLIDAIAMCVQGTSQNQMYRRVLRGAKKGIRTAEQLFSYPGVAYICHRIQPDGMAQVQLNSAYCTMFGAHPEELLARLGRQELPSVFSDFDALCLLLNCLDWTMCGGVEVFQWYCAIGRGTRYTSDMEPSLVRIDIRVRCDADGQPSLIENWFFPLTDDEFDLTSELNPLFCRPFAAISGDTRRAAELRRSYSAERATSLIEQTQHTSKSEISSASSPVPTRTELSWHQRLCLLGDVVSCRFQAAQQQMALHGTVPSYPYMSNTLIPEPGVDQTEGGKQYYDDPAHGRAQVHTGGAQVHTGVPCIDEISDNTEGEAWDQICEPAPSVSSTRKDATPGDGVLVAKPDSQAEECGGWDHHSADHTQASRDASGLLADFEFSGWDAEEEAIMMPGMTWRGPARAANLNSWCSLSEIERGLGPLAESELLFPSLVWLETVTH